jgi:hypothetical protein
MNENAHSGNKIVQRIIMVLIGPSSTDIEDGIGRVLRMGFHPTITRYLCRHCSWWTLRSQNAGTSWTNIASFLPSLGVSGIEVNKDNPDIIYVYQRAILVVRWFHC